MQRLQAFKFELLPNGEQERTMRRVAGACRFVYNEALALQKVFQDGLTGIPVCAPLHWRPHAVTIAQINVVTHSDLIAVIDHWRPRQ